MKKKICVITGTRADYGILRPVMDAIKGSASLQLYIIATCMHLMKEFGYTVKEIERNGYKIYKKIDISYKNDTGEAMGESVGKAIFLFSRAFVELRPDVVVVLGDRGEMLAAAVAANYLNVPVAHIHGGEISGHIDGILRHAITKLSHIHFPATKAAQRRIIKMGEEPWRVFLTGAPALDTILAGRSLSQAETLRKYGVGLKEPLVLVVQHPVSTQIKDAKPQMQTTMAAMEQIKARKIVIYPNADAGGRKMIEAIKRYKNNPAFDIYKSVPHEDYLGLMRLASVLIGNSSSGIIEAPSWDTPVVNIGIRQDGRERSANIVDVPHDKDKIIKAVKRMLGRSNGENSRKKMKNVYGDGTAGKRIGKILSAICCDRRLLQKQMAY